MEYPFTTEYSRSARAGCKICKDTIQKDVLRMGRLLQSPHFDGYITHWYHFECFFNHKKFKIGLTSSQIKGFEEIRFEDQKLIEDNIKAAAPSTPAASSKTNKSKKGDDETGKKKAAPRKRKSDADPVFVINPSAQEFAVEYAKSNRSKCKVCECVIEKDDVRIGKQDTDSDDAKRFGPLFRWFHPKCFAENRDDLEFHSDASLLPNFECLKKSDQKKLLKNLPASKSAKKPKLEPVALPKVEEMEVDASMETKLKAQSDKLYQYTEMLNGLKRKQLEALLELNQMPTNHDRKREISYLADALAFGVPEMCPQCSSPLRFKTTNYRCTGISEWGAQCEYKADQPKRRRLEIPPELKDHPLMVDYRYKPGKRIYNQQYKAEVERKEMESMAALLDVKEEHNGDTGNNGDNSKPLSHYHIGLLINNMAMKEKVNQLGGTLVKNDAANKNVLCYVCEAKRYPKEKKNINKNAKLVHAQDNKVPVVSELFLVALLNGSSLFDAMKNNVLEFWDIGDRDEHIAHRIENFNVKSKLDGIFKSGSKPGPSTSLGTKKIVCKSGGTVDPDSNLENLAHILRENGTIYNAVLNLVNLKGNKNSYYKLQVLESNEPRHPHYWLFKAWGRVGTEIGGNSCNSAIGKYEAVQEFERIYYEHTGNRWQDRANFQKLPNMYFEVDIDYGTAPTKLHLESSKSTLAMQIKQLIVRIFDENLMNKTMMEFELDLNKMPLGKLSHAQLLRACSVLKLIAEMLTTKPINLSQLQGSCNHFYSLVPHNFGLSTPPLINSLDQVTKKNAMLEALLEMEVAYSIMKDQIEGTDPIDHHYNKLKNSITVMDPKENDYKVIVKYVKMTHGKTHEYKLKVLNIFRLEREGEAERFAPYSTNDNRKLLWHGSRTTNYGGILSQGLRIAPPEAPPTGYMFGKGIYFADSVSKSANYCFVSDQDGNDNHGLLVLSEVALGKSKPLKNATDVKKLDSKYMSVLGVGRSVPNPDQAVTLDNGVQVPCGRLINNKEAKNAVLLYNEYIIYNEHQARMRYLVEVEFEFDDYDD